MASNLEHEVGQAGSKNGHTPSQVVVPVVVVVIGPRADDVVEVGVVSVATRVVIGPLLDDSVFVGGAGGTNVDEGFCDVTADNTMGVVRLVDVDCVAFVDWVELSDCVVFGVCVVVGVCVVFASCVELLVVVTLGKVVDVD